MVEVCVLGAAICLLVDGLLKIIRGKTSNNEMSSSPEGSEAPESRKKRKK